MKKTLAFVVALMLVLSLVACGNDNTPTDGDTTATPPADGTTTPTPDNTNPSINTSPDLEDPDQTGAPIDPVRVPSSNQDVDWPSEILGFALPAPEGITKISSLAEARIDLGNTVTVTLNTLSYETFRSYIASLRSDLGFQDESEGAFDLLTEEIPADEYTAWSGNNDKIWLNLVWIGDNSSNYNGYNTRIIVTDYNPMEE